jgi:pectate lyase
MEYTVVVLSVVATALAAKANLPAFPGAEGAGMYAVGGRGGQVYEVTNLNDRGPGSLRAAIQAQGPRTVVFRVSGNIELRSGLRITNPYITIAGQTAPGGGICLKNYGLAIAADDVIVRYIRSRPGDNMGEQVDAISISSGRNIILDHCSTSWAVDETLSASASDGLDKVTVQWCLIAESLNCSVHAKGCHGYGSLIRGSWGSAYTYHHNLFAHHKGRSPRPGNYNTYSVDPNGFNFGFQNNVVYNWQGTFAGYNGDADSITRMNFIGNYYKQGPNSTDCYAFRESCTHDRIYFSGNSMNGSYPSSPWDLVIFNNFTEGQKDICRQSGPLEAAPVSVEDAMAAFEHVLAQAGATQPQRDAVDERIINSVITGTGKIIDDEDEVGGWPDLASVTPLADTDHDGMSDDWELLHKLDPNNTNDRNGDIDGNGYTNLEQYLNRLCSESHRGLKSLAILP